MPLRMYVRCYKVTPDYSKECWAPMQEVFQENYSIVNEDGKIVRDAKEVIRIILTQKHYIKKFNSNLFLAALLLIEYYGINYFNYTMEFIMNREDFPGNNVYFMRDEYLDEFNDYNGMFYGH